MANGHRKGCSTSLIIKKITMRYHLMLVKMAIIKKKAITLFYQKAMLVRMWRKESLCALLVEL